MPFDTSVIPPHFMAQGLQRVELLVEVRRDGAPYRRTEDVLFPVTFGDFARIAAYSETNSRFTDYRKVFVREA